MQAIVQSSFLQALAFALINNIWQMALLWLALLLVFRLFNLSSPQKFNIAFIAQLTGFLIFIYSLVHAYLHKTSFAFLNDSRFVYIIKLQIYFNRLLAYTGIIYLVLLTWQLIKLVFNYQLVQNMRKLDLKKMTASNRIFVQQLTSVLSLKRKVKIYISSKIKCPLTLGFLKPVILIPLAAINHLTKEQMEAVILHELAHIKRYDYLFNLIQSFINKIFFFNVFSNMIYVMIEYERENACDDFVLQFKYNSFHYAEALLKMGRLQTNNGIAMAATGKKENILLLRIKRLIHGNTNNFQYDFAYAAQYIFITIITLPVIFILLGNNISIQLKPGTKILSNVSVQKLPARSADALSLFPEVKYLAKATTEKSINKSSFKKDNISSAANKKSFSPNYFVDVKQSLDSLKPLNYNEALNKQFVINEDAYKKAISYQNFRQLEAMLYASGNSINITEDPKSKNSYHKLITIESTDAKGNKNVYKVIVELYQ